MTISLMLMLAVGLFGFYEIAFTDVSPASTPRVDEITSAMIKEIYDLNSWVQEGPINAKLGRDYYEKSKFKSYLGYDGRYYYLEATSPIKGESKFHLKMRDEGTFYLNLTSDALLNRDQWTCSAQSAKCDNVKNESNGLPQELVLEISDKCTGRFDFKVKCNDPNPLGTGYRIRIYYMPGYMANK